MKTALPILFALSACAASGCADLMNRSAVAPEWFEAKATEVKGEGYPKLSDIPAIVAPDDLQTWERERDTLEQAAAEVETDAALSGELPTPDEIRARAAQLRASIPE